LPGTKLKGSEENRTVTDEMDLSGRCAVVTGGGHGIGRALAERLAHAGARVVVADLNQERAFKVAERVQGLAVHCDVGDRSSLLDLISTAEKAFGPVGVFCSNAGIAGPGTGLETTPEDLEHITRVNLLAHVWASQAVVPQMVAAGGGYIVQTISSAALITGPSSMGYTLTKHGALGFAEWLALNYAHLGIVVSCLCPNAVNTGMLGRNEDEDAEVPASAGPGLIGLGDVVEPEACADMVLAAMSQRRFLVLPHARVGESFARKASDYDKWLEGTSRRLRRMRGDES
jgi:NAD(P)-dependent dehydrogenase (short-subunit alcohol dehydrogenase family)